MVLAGGVLSVYPWCPHNRPGPAWAPPPGGWGDGGAGSVLVAERGSTKEIVRGHVTRK